MWGHEISGVCGMSQGEGYSQLKGRNDPPEASGAA